MAVTRTMQSPRRHGLSKSKISAFEQCPKRLWLSVHRPELAQFDEGAELRFAAGHEVGAAACSLVSDGVMVEADPDLAAAVARTRALLDAGHDAAIFEATFQHEGVLVRVDILEPDGTGGWRIAEVKSSTKAKDYHLGDLATQVWTVRNAGLSISSAAIRHVDSGFVLTREGDWEGLFHDVELLDTIEPITADRELVVAAARETLAGPEPAVEVGAQCSAPFACEFAGHCHAALPPGPKWPVTILPNGGGKRWLELGIVDLHEVDAAALANKLHQRVHRATIDDEHYHDVDGARAAMAGWTYPRIWLDFETIAFAVPRWIGTRPYQQVPFQFSAHVEMADGSVEHREFLSLDGNDPRRACAEALTTLIPDEGTVIAYNASFEKTCIRDLAKAFPDLSEALLSICNRVVDLLPVAKANWYHRDQRGSWSIKAVLPTVAPHLDYAGLAVKDGAHAQAAYLEAIAEGTTPERWQELDEGLRAYCCRDTEAMMVLAARLSGSPAPPIVGGAET